MALPELPVTRLTGLLTLDQVKIIEEQLKLPQGVAEQFVGGDIVVIKGAKEPYDRLEIHSPTKDDRWSEITVTNSRGGLTETTKGVTEIYSVCHPFSDKCDDDTAVATYRPGTAALADKFIAQFSCSDQLFTKDMNVYRAKLGFRPCEPLENWKLEAERLKGEAYDLMRNEDFDTAASQFSAVAKIYHDLGRGASTRAQAADYYKNEAEMHAQAAFCSKQIAAEQDVWRESFRLEGDAWELAAENADDPKLALNYYEKAGALYKKSYDPAYAVDTWIKIGDIQLRLGNYADAVSSYKAADKNVGIAFKAGQFDKAAAATKKGIIAEKIKEAESNVK